MASPSFHRGKLVLLMGPSGVGKSVILQELRKRHPSWHFPRSATTRPRREGEGDDLYVFVSEKEFDALIVEGKLIEWAVVHEGAKYGTLIEEIVPAIEAGHIVVREVDVQGFEAIHSHPLFLGQPASFRLQSIFILPESKEQLVEHIRGRAPIAPEELARRLASMEREMQFAARCDHAVTNADGKLAQTVTAVEGIIAGDRGHV